MSLRSRILRELDRRPSRLQDLQRSLGEDRKVMLVVNDMLREGKIKRHGDTYFIAKKQVDLANAIPCSVVKVAARFGFVTRDDGEGDIFIPGRCMLGCMPGDHVLVSLFEHPRVEGSQEGEVLSISEANNRFVGTVVRLEDGRLALTPDRCPALSLIIKKSADGGVKEGDKAACEILERGTHHAEHRVGITMRFGTSSRAKMCAKALLYDRGIEKHFPDAVKAEAAPYEGAQVSAAAMEGRMDLRGLPIFTIDSAETKDIDDAISMMKVSDGYELGVHIADVSEYVRPGTALDDEAFKRATSVYYADSVVPMLPRALSNGVCSLNENETRLAFSCLMKLDMQGNIRDYRFVKTVIRSRVKGVYKEINALIEGGAGADLQEKYQAVLNQFDAMQEVYEQRIRQRAERGGIDFETGESKLILDDEGVCVDVVLRERGLSEKMIEEFMLLANQCAANMARVKKLPFVYRVHEAPDSERMERLQKTLVACGLNVHFKAETPTQLELQAIIDQVKDTPLEKPVAVGVLRSMAKAKYEPVAKGHFGLSLEDYAHFTSPIRRYPDLAIHRIMSAFLAGESSEQLHAEYDSFAANASAQSSKMEVNAMQVERTADDYYKAEYMTAHVGECYTGVVSGLAQHGLYVQLDNSCEGMIRLEELCKGTPIVTDGVRVTDPLTGKSWMMGEPLAVQIAAADIALGRVDMVPAPAEA